MLTSMELQKLNFSPEETGAIVGVSKFTILRDVRNGRINATKYGRRVLIGRDEVERLAKQGMPAVSAANSGAR